MILCQIKEYKVFKIFEEVEYRCDWLFEPESLFRLYSVITFDLQEDLLDYDVNYNKPKIEAFKKKAEIFSTILRKLVSGSETLLNLSQEDLNQYISKLQERLQMQQELILPDTP